MQTQKRAFAREASLEIYPIRDLCAISTRSRKGVIHCRSSVSITIGSQQLVGIVEFAFGRTGCTIISSRYVTHDPDSLIRGDDRAAGARSLVVRRNM